MFHVEKTQYSQLTDEQKLKARCRATTNTMIARGLITRGVCEVCGDKNVEAHHEDYNKPSQVRWLCKKHHRHHHDSIRKKKRSNICSCGCGKEIETERVASGQHYTKACHAAYMRRFRANQKLQIESMKAELKQLKNEP